MKRKLLLFSVLLLSGKMLQAQALNSVTDLRLYEHHSHTIRGAQSANGSKSGYDFVVRDFYHSYNAANFGAYLNGEEANIDMVEHNGPYGNGQNGGKFGFTSGTSTIWVNEIKGNGTTKWMKAPAGFDYTTIDNVSQIAAAYNEATATQNITTVEENTVYLARVRNTSLYVAMRTATVKNKTTGDDDVYFDFEYKYGTLSTATAIGDVTQTNTLSIYPNPAVDNVILENKGDQTMATKIISAGGQLVQTFSLDRKGIKNIDVSQMSTGLYFIVCTSGDGRNYTYKFIKQ